MTWICDILLISHIPDNLCSLFVYFKADRINFIFHVNNLLFSVIVWRARTRERERESERERERERERARERKREYQSEKI